MPIPFLLVGDHPQLPSGLGRILRDLAQRFADDSTLDLDVRVVGCRPGGSGPDGMPNSGVPVWSFSATNDFGADLLQQVSWAWEKWWGNQPGVVLTIWDAVRIQHLAHSAGQVPWDHWAYVPIDAHMTGGRLVGAPAATLHRVERVLAYTNYGAEVLHRTLGRQVPWLPHGIESSWFTPRYDPGNEIAAQRQNWLGVVMTNQPRKAWGLALATLAILRHRGHRMKVWAHVDRPVGPAWDLPLLLESMQLSRKTIELTSTGDHWSDDQLRQAYQRCGVTMLPSLGEGFGYPLVESLAAGVPVVHSTEAGGAELLARPEWKVPKRGEVIDGPYALLRPVFDPADWANAIERVWDWQGKWADQGAGYCQGSVAHLRWTQLYPRWRSWVKQGLQEMEL